MNCIEELNNILNRLKHFDFDWRTINNIWSQTRWLNNDVLINNIDTLEVIIYICHNFVNNFVQYILIACRPLNSRLFNGKRWPTNTPINLKHLLTECFKHQDTRQKFKISNHLQKSYKVLKKIINNLINFIKKSEQFNLI